MFEMREQKLVDALQLFSFYFCYMILPFQINIYICVNKVLSIPFIVSVIL